jgi:asparagine N-glycosylation enzyme membrane subunit Stt3
VTKQSTSESAVVSGGNAGATVAFRLALLWILASVIGLVIDLAPIRASLVEGHYLPVGPDSFYHARRILDAVADPGAVYQFDPLIHAPDGALISWPWGYDYLVSLIVRAAGALGLGGDAMAVIAHIPVFAFPITLLLVVAVCRFLRLSLPATGLALLATALFPLSQTLYGIGDIDHHFAEHMLVMGTLAASMAWLAQPQSWFRAALAALVLGIAPAVHTAEFILQLPLLAALALLWLRGDRLPETTPVFAGTLLASTLAIALPSLPLQQGRFDYLTLSWFQVYIAFCSAVTCVFLWRARRGRNSLIAAIVLCAVLLVPIVGAALRAGEFFAGNVEGMGDIMETRSIIDQLRIGLTWESIFGRYSHLLMLLPLVAVFCVLRLRREQQSARVLFWIACLFGLVMLVSQTRLHYLGSYALYVPLLLLVDESILRLPAKPAVTWSVVALIILGAHVVALPRLFGRQFVGGDGDYELTRPLYARLADACDKQPGVALANSMDGNYLRFHTKCAVIGTAFLLTPTDIAKNQEEDELLALPAAEIPRRKPLLRYAFIRRQTLFVSLPDGRWIIAPEDHPMLVDPPLVKELLHADKDRLPAHYRLLGELTYPTPPHTAYSRVFAIDP